MKAYYCDMKYALSHEGVYFIPDDQEFRDDGKRLITFKLAPKEYVTLYYNNGVFTKADLNKKYSILIKTKEKLQIFGK